MKEHLPLFATNLWPRVIGRMRRSASDRLFRHPFPMRNARPIISFSFDDFPDSALSTAAPILESFGIQATFYVSLGLLGSLAPTGRIVSRKELTRVPDRGHELGCHTFDHLDAFSTPSLAFLESIEKNRQHLRELSPDYEFRTLSYPISGPRPNTKRHMSDLFVGCRAGGQRINHGIADLSALKAFFLEQSRDRPEAIFTLIRETLRQNGWLIFATHDVCDEPTRFGVTPRFFKQITQYAVESGAMILPVGQALDEILKTSVFAE